ncbi:biotin--[acetyl-CoA-carboxylase] ligase [Natronobacterium gregoryi]|uniref:Biotin--[acetyl-CoA-carboxylase] ligase n=2 Tax=Natronobacterium gregoryi TaxID=44930 RepID=L0AHV6_NATGS|nr:biotin--[acetyl-CoA-carboxylase] ligase [Natronobacterium gregoryi]AFZ73391.1 birA, biotin-(acetyl-CoA-carboxylase) ligase [Natronobacterium gregoryi SP2]ELY68587.1 biotin--acetyl-CoA-carboxylase ligase [Natronobacterium gregoryi SP2]PLK19670.1 biotin--[acetyl-CoA-carboxylase] ligase [Natronobacterium gregoryi SP2]SFI73390.1 BirA family transcriptional regulator, biotin operon repressor / biotin-[acetyl-CoA-carboxylase] ligase [Natronobacterium gregoryi]
MNETRHAILEELADGPASGPELADSLEISRAAIWKHVEALREAGFEIESEPTGYRLEEIAAYSGPAVEFRLEAPFEIEYHDAVGSTNDRARERATAGDEDVVVLADEQTGGRGRLERAWAAPSGGVWASVVTRPSIAPAQAPLYTLAAAVATARAVREAGVDAGIKWPNDVILPGVGNEYRKLAGILTEMEGETDRVSWLVVGIGVNANVDAADLPEGATSIRAEAGDIDRRRFVQRLLEEFDRYRTDLEAVVPVWRELAATIGQRVSVDRPGGEVVGEAVDVTESGALVVETDDGERASVTAGDCEHLRPV